MKSEIAISVTREETRVAVLENRVVTELFVDRPRKKDFVGDIYKGKVIKVLPGMQAAFVDIGLDRAAFIHVSDLSVGTEPGDTLVDSVDDYTRRFDQLIAKASAWLPVPDQEVPVDAAASDDRDEEHAGGGEGGPANASEEAEEPMQRTADGSAAGISKHVAPRALFYFRWSALITWLAGAALLGANFGNAFLLRPSHAAIGVGAWLGTIMLINVWGVIWPNQKKVLGMVEASDDEKNKARRVAFLASRTNTMLSIPMLFFMANSGHASGLF